MRSTLELCAGTTGTIFPSLASTPPSGWLLLNGDTIGKTGSGAAKAGPQYKKLYLLIWSNLANAEAAVSTGRGASATADWDAGKTLAIPDFRGRALIGAGAGSGLTVRTIGTKGGAETHTLSAAEIPAHSHPNTLTDPGHIHSGNVRLGTSGGGFGYPYGSTADNANHALTINTATTGITITNANNTGGGGAHNIMQPWGAVNFMVKL